MPKAEGTTPKKGVGTVSKPEPARDGKFEIPDVCGTGTEQKNSGSYF